MFLRINTINIVLLLIICFLAHFGLVSLGLWITGSDQAWQILESDRFLTLKATPFYFGQWYGGPAMAPFRALWALPWSDYIRAQMTFSFIVQPILMLMFGLYMVFSFTPVQSIAARLFMGLLLAIGFHHWAIFQFGDDFYIFIFLVSCIFLGLKMRFENPFVQTTLGALFGLSFLSGFSAYTSRSILIYLLAFWLPFPLFFSEFKAFLKSRSPLLYISIFFVMLFLFLEIHGRQIGPLRMDSGPNLDIAILCALIFSFRRNFWLIRSSKFYFKRVAVFISGFSLGILPEWIYRLSSGPATSSNSWWTNDLPEIPRILATLPAAFSEIFLSSDTSAFKYLAAAFWVTSILYCISHLKDKRVWPVLLALTLALVAFVRVRTFTVGAPRYLFFAMAAAIGCATIWVDAWMSKRTPIWKKAIVILLVSSTLIHQSLGRKQMIDYFTDRSNCSSCVEAEKIISVFEKTGVNTVISDDYDFSNNLTLMTNKKIAFIVEGRDQPLELYERSLGEKRVGLLFRERRNQFETSTDHGVFRLTYLVYTQSHFLYLGVKRD